MILRPAWPRVCSLVMKHEMSCKMKLVHALKILLRFKVVCFEAFEFTYIAEWNPLFLEATDIFAEWADHWYTCVLHLSCSAFICSLWVHLLKQPLKSRISLRSYRINLCKGPLHMDATWVSFPWHCLPVSSDKLKLSAYNAKTATECFKSAPCTVFSFYF
jgi:hypothetical protein